MNPASRYLPILLRATLLVLTVSAAPAWAGAPGLEVFPTHPSCFYETTLVVRGDLPDGCFGVEDISLIQNPPSFVFEVHMVDSWEPGLTCDQIVVPYSRHETVGPLPGGFYTLIRDEIVDSVRYVGSDLTLPFTVACCEPLPSPVTDLRVGKTESYGRIRLTWTDTAEADTCSIYKDSEPEGPFATLEGIVPSGEGGVDVWLSATYPPPPMELFLVSGNNACGSGHPRDNGQ